MHCVLTCLALNPGQITIYSYWAFLSRLPTHLKPTSSPQTTFSSANQSPSPGNHGMLTVYHHGDDCLAKFCQPTHDAQQPESLRGKQTLLRLVTPRDWSKVCFAYPPLLEKDRIWGGYSDSRFVPKAISTCTQSLCQHKLQIASSVNKQTHLIVTYWQICLRARMKIAPVIGEVARWCESQMAHRVLVKSSALYRE